MQRALLRVFGVPLRAETPAPKARETERGVSALLFCSSHQSLTKRGGNKTHCVLQVIFVSVFLAEAASSIGGEKRTQSDSKPRIPLFLAEDAESCSLLLGSWSLGLGAEFV